MAEMIDLTPRLEEGMSINHPYHPRGPLIFDGNQRFEFLKLHNKNFWSEHGPPPAQGGLPEDWTDPESARGWQNEYVLVHTHLGTHVDAPSHYNPDGSDIDEIDLDWCWGDAVMLDFRDLCEEPHSISIEDLERAEEEAGTAVEDVDIVILHTGWLARWGHDREKYGDVPNPGLGVETPQWFIDREITLVGGDIANIDYDMRSSGHVNFLCREAADEDPILICENLANLERIPQPTFTFFALPLPIERGSGSPVRAVAVVDS